MRENLIRLDAICDLNMGQSPKSESYNDEGDGLPFFQGNADFGDMYPNIRMWCNEPTKVVEKDSLLISVRAPIGALNFSREKSCIGRGLAGITAKSDINLKYVYYNMKYKKDDLINKGTGSTFKAINKSTLGETLIRICSKDEQDKCVDVLDRVSSIINCRKEQLDELDHLIKSRFVEMFGDPVSNPFNWRKDKLSHIGNLGRGVSKHRPRNAPELLGGQYPLIQTGDVANADLYITEYKSTYSELGLKQSKLWKKGTLCITIAANIAKTSILSFDACFPDSVVGFAPNENTNNIFMHYWFAFFQQLLESQAPESAQKNINLKILSDLNVIVPPKEEQDQFEVFVHCIDKLKCEVRKSLNEVEKLFDSLMQECFE